MSDIERWDYCDECGELKPWVLKLVARKRPSHKVYICLDCIAQLKLKLTKKVRGIE